ncbi:hypothetical protein [Streptomyces sp. 769]|nr:hypothetical protein [Streptomyces sp. 769]
MGMPRLGGSTCAKTVTNVSVSAAWTQTGPNSGPTPKPRNTTRGAAPM